VFTHRKEDAVSAPMPHSKPEVEVPISNDSSISEYCRFVRVVRSIPPLEGFDANFDVGVEQVDVSPCEGQERICLVRKQCVMGPSYKDEGPLARASAVVHSTKEVRLCGP